MNSSWLSSVSKLLHVGGGWAFPSRCWCLWVMMLTTGGCGCGKWWARSMVLVINLPHVGNGPFLPVMMLVGGEGNRSAVSRAIYIFLKISQAHDTYDVLFLRHCLGPSPAVCMKLILAPYSRTRGGHAWQHVHHPPIVLNWCCGGSAPSSVCLACIVGLIAVRISVWCLINLTSVYLFPYISHPFFFIASSH